MLTCVGYYLLIYNLAQLKGNPVRNTGIFAFTELGGYLIIPIIKRYLPTKIFLTFSFVVVIVINYFVKFTAISEGTQYGLILVQAFFYGYIVTQHFLIGNSVIPFKYRSMSFNINYCLGNVLSATSPLIAQAKEPVPVIAIWTICVVCILVTLSIKFEDTS